MKTLLQLLGFRSKCCNAKIETWHAHKEYCSACERWLNQPVSHVAEAMNKQVIKHHTKRAAH